LNSLVCLPARFGYICCCYEQLDLLHAAIVGVRLCKRFLNQSVCVVNPPEFQ